MIIDLGDERGTCVGAVHCDLEDEPLEFPCYALFLDPANALIIKSQHREPCKDDKDNAHEDRLVPKRILCTTDLGTRKSRTPQESVIVWLRTDRPGVSGDIVQISTDEFERLARQSGAMEGWENSFIDKSQYVIRIGIGVFVKGGGKPDDNGAGKGDSTRSYDPKVHGKLKLEDVLHVEGDQSWGVVTKHDTKIPVAIF